MGHFHMAFKPFTQCPAVICSCQRLDLHVAMVTTAGTLQLCVCGSVWMRGIAAPAGLLHLFTFSPQLTAHFSSLSSFLSVPPLCGQRCPHRPSLYSQEQCGSLRYSPGCCQGCHQSCPAHPPLALANHSHGHSHNHTHVLHQNHTQALNHTHLLNHNHAHGLNHNHVHTLNHTLDKNHTHTLNHNHMHTLNHNHAHVLHQSQSIVLEQNHMTVRL